MLHCRFRFETAAVLLMAASGCTPPPSRPVESREPISGVAGAAGAARSRTGLGAAGTTCSADDDCRSGHCESEICCAEGDCCVSEEDCDTVEGQFATCDDPEDCQGTSGAVICERNFQCGVRDGVDDDSRCTEDTLADDCGLYAAARCNGNTSQRAPECAEACSDDDDCDPWAHCLAGECVHDLDRGAACTEDRECTSEHCSQGICCKEGDCCTTAADCDPDKYGEAPTCDEEETCQGSRMAPVCDDHQCTTGPAEDDSACDRTIVARECEGSPNVYCSGESDQQSVIPCASGSCSSGFRPTNSCNDTAFCLSNVCTPDQPLGEACPDDDACQSGHCQNGFCCLPGGDCCEDDSQCETLSTCSDAGTCQGTRQERTCDVERHICVPSGDPIEDDSACQGEVAATECGLNLPARCSGGASQSMPPASSCPPCTLVPICPFGFIFAGGSSCARTVTVDGETERQTESVIRWSPVGCMAGATTCSAGRCR
jgi:hypothetical protein